MEGLHTFEVALESMFIILRLEGLVSIGVVCPVQPNARIHISFMFEDPLSSILHIVMVPCAKVNTPVPPMMTHSPSNLF